VADVGDSLCRLCTLQCKIFNSVDSTPGNSFCASLEPQWNAKIQSKLSRLMKLGHPSYILNTVCLHKQDMMLGTDSENSLQQNTFVTSKETKDTSV